MAMAETAQQATMIVPLTLVPQLIFAGVLVPKLPEFATAFAKVAVSGYWLTESMKDNLISDSPGGVEIIDASTGQIAWMDAENAGLGAVIISAHILVFVLLTVVSVISRARKRG